VYSTATLGLEEALRIVGAVVEAARAADGRTWPGVAVAVVDKQGELIAAARMDGMAPRFGRAAHRKAYTAAVMERDTAGVMDFWNRQEDAGHRGAHDWNDSMLTTLPGGYVVKYRTQVVGGIGVSGGSGPDHHDGYFADLAIRTLGDGFRHSSDWERKHIGD
jgi:uncharacterized protein GlcG (DUF336 family)